MYNGNANKQMDVYKAKKQEEKKKKQEPRHKSKIWLFGKKIDETGKARSSTVKPITSVFY